MRSRSCYLSATVHLLLSRSSRLLCSTNINTVLQIRFQTDRIQIRIMPFKKTGFGTDKNTRIRNSTVQQPLHDLQISLHCSTWDVNRNIIWIYKFRLREPLESFRIPAASRSPQYYSVGPKKICYSIYVSH